MRSYWKLAQQSAIRHWMGFGLISASLTLGACKSPIVPQPEQPPLTPSWQSPSSEAANQAIGTGVSSPQRVRIGDSNTTLENPSQVQPGPSGYGNPASAPATNQQSSQQFPAAQRQEVALVSHESPVEGSTSESLTEESTDSLTVTHAPYAPRTDGYPIQGGHPQQGLESIPPYQWRHPSGPPSPWNHEEYLRDGGDRNSSALIGKDWSIRGLDIEDTIAHFDTLAGERVVEPSNQVQIYAPRFGSVRKVYGILQDQAYNHMGQTGQTSQIAANLDFRGSILAHQNQQPLGQNGRKMSNEFLDQTRGLTVENPQIVSTFSNVFAAYEDNALVRWGQVENSEKARLAEAMVAAEVWQDELPVQVVVDNRNPIVSRGVEKTQEEVGLDVKESRPKLRVIKLASTETAQPGDIVEFTIRFDNIGNETVGNVTLLDNLTARLEYIEGSAECDLEFDFFTTENESGSLLLRWEIVEPVEPETGGILRFKCKVR